MNEFLKLLLPWKETSNDQISDIFVYGILSTFIILLVIFLWKTIHRARLIDSLTKEVGKYGRPAKPDILHELKNAFDRNGKLAEAWQEFEDSLITRRRDENQEQVVYKTDEASLFFSEERLLEQHLNLRFWNSVPALLVGIGILGTFVGLVWGLIPFSGIDFTQTDKIKEAIKSLLSGVSTAFVTSVWGMLTSLLFNGLEKWRVGRMSGALANLQHALDQLFTLTTQEEISFRQEDELAQQTQALKSFSTDLADRIKVAMDNIMSERLDNLDQGLTQLHNQSARSSQEIVQELHKVPEALSSAITEQLKPTFNNLNTTVETLRRQKEESSTEAIRQLVEEFQKSLSGSVAVQMEGLSETLSKVSQGLISLPQQMVSMIDGVQEHVNQTRQLLSETSQEQTKQTTTMLNEMLNTFQIAVDTQQNRLYETTGRVNEEMTQITADIRDLLVGTANRTDQQLAQRIADMETVSAQSIQTLQTTIIELQQAMTVTASQTTEKSEAMINRMHELLESSANRTDKQLAQRMADMETVSTQSIQTLQTIMEELQQTLAQTAAQNAEESRELMKTMLSTFQSAINSQQTGLSETSNLLNEEMRQVATNIQHLLESAANRADEQLGQRIMDIEQISVQSIKTLQTTIAELQQSITSTASQTGEESAEMISRMRKLLESAANLVDDQLAQRMLDMESTSAESIQTLQAAITELQQVLTRTAAQTTEGSSEMIARMNQLLESSASRVDQQLAQRMSDIETASVESTQTLQTVITHLQESITSTASQVTEKSEAMISRMHQLMDQSGDRLNNIFQVGELSVSKLLQQQAGQIKEVNAQMVNSREILEKSREVLQHMVSGVTGASELVKMTQALSEQLMIGVDRLEDAGEQLMEASDAFREDSSEYLKANRETIEQIQRMQLQSQQLLNDFAKRFETIDAGLKSIFEEIERGLTEYTVTTRESINMYLNEFSDQLTSASSALSSSVNALTESVEELNDMSERLTRQRGNR